MPLPPPVTFEAVFIEPIPAPAPAPVPAPRVSYANCTAVKAAGAAPIYKGEPGYSTDLDRDRDGIACDT
uniref:excalibur calcium-binding domain-containing protein n=1 Tax=unclassified Rhodococcus (in: high G+C Gram-positive bacteria) TaxID=192944 RepID=UPI0020CF518A|nr:MULTISPECIES: excalibur calcium-binding domain-containing protein [unclassified Rhodococcus (in: high G+C Gram-positive bacteria)]